MMNTIKKFFKEEHGLATIEIGIILAVVVALAVVFRKQIANMWNAVFDGLKEGEEGIKEDPDIKGP